MKVHRVRSAKATDDLDKPHIFVECEEGLWHEMGEIPTHKQIHDFVARGCDNILGYGNRAFHIGIVRSWVEESPITERGG